MMYKTALNKTPQKLPWLNHGVIQKPHTNDNKQSL